MLAVKVADAPATTDLRALLNDALQAPARPKASAAPPAAAPQLTPPLPPATAPAVSEAPALPVPEASKAMEEAIRATSTLDSTTSGAAALGRGPAAPQAAAEQLSKAVEGSGGAAEQAAPAAAEQLSKAVEAGGQQHLCMCGTATVIETTQSCCACEGSSWSCCIEGGGCTGQTALRAARAARPQRCGSIGRGGWGAAGSRGAAGRRIRGRAQRCRTAEQQLQLSARRWPARSRQVGKRPHG